MKTGENAMSADNEQERLNTDWVVGFVDGEGCFHVSINKISKMSLGWQVLPEFRVVQHEKEVKILLQLQRFFGMGIVVKNHGSRKELRIRGHSTLKELVRFFNKNPLRTSKQKDFEIFAQIISLMDQGKHLTRDGLKKISILRSKMNRQVKPKYLESPETIR